VYFLNLDNPAAGCYQFLKSLGGI